MEIISGLKNTRQQDFVLLAKYHYGQSSEWVEDARTILSQHCCIEPCYISDQDLAKALMSELYPLLNGNQCRELLERLIDSHGAVGFIRQLLGVISTIPARENGKWILPFPECSADVRLFRQCGQRLRRAIVEGQQ